MSSLQFLLPQREGLSQLAIDGAYLIGADGTPWNTRVEVRQHVLTVTRNTRESGHLIIPWPMPDFGPLALSTATLVPREAPYHLALELCRGTLARIAQQLDARWFEDPELAHWLREAHRQFILASLQQTDVERSAEAAEQGIYWALACIRRCGQQAMHPRGGQSGFASYLIGLQTSSAEDLSAARNMQPFPANAIFHTISWRQTEPAPGEWDWSAWHSTIKACQSSRRRIIGGPLIQLERSTLPDWLYLWDDDFESLQAYVDTYVRHLVREIGQNIHAWYATAGTNIDRAFRLSEEHRLRLTITVLEALRNESPRVPVLLGIQQPWGEYLSRSSFDLSPAQFTDILARADVGISGLVLELQMAASTQYTLPRDLLETHRLLELWSTLGLPIVVSLSMPSEANGFEQARVDYLRDLLDACARKPMVQGVVWRQLQDTPQFPGGLLTSRGELKKVAQLWRELYAQSRRKS